MTPQLLNFDASPVASETRPTRSRRTKKSRTELVADFLKARAGQWIDGLEISHVGGAYAWRTRLSDCRQQFGMVIENRMVPGSMTGRFRSEYRYVPSEGK